MTYKLPKEQITEENFAKVNQEKVYKAYCHGYSEFLYTNKVQRKRLDQVIKGLTGEDLGRNFEQVLAELQEHGICRSIGTNGQSCLISHPAENFYNLSVVNGYDVNFGRPKQNPYWFNGLYLECYAIGHLLGTNHIDIKGIKVEGIREMTERIADHYVEWEKENEMIRLEYARLEKLSKFVRPNINIYIEEVLAKRFPGVTYTEHKMLTVVKIPLPGDRLLKVCIQHDKYLEQMISLQKQLDQLINVINATPVPIRIESKAYHIPDPIYKIC